MCKLDACCIQSSRNLDMSVKKNTGILLRQQVPGEQNDVMELANSGRDHRSVKEPKKELV